MRLLLLQDFIDWLIEKTIDIIIILMLIPILVLIFVTFILDLLFGVYEYGNL